VEEGTTPLPPSRGGVGRRAGPSLVLLSRSPVSPPPEGGRTRYALHGFSPHSGHLLAAHLFGRPWGGWTLCQRSCPPPLLRVAPLDGAGRRSPNFTPPPYLWGGLQDGREAPFSRGSPASLPLFILTIALNGRGPLVSFAGPRPLSRLSSTSIAVGGRRGRANYSRPAVTAPPHPSLDPTGPGGGIAGARYELHGPPPFASDFGGRRVEAGIT